MVRKEPQVVVVTGASAGVGRAIARAFATRHAHLGLLARGQEGLAATVRDVEARGGRALAVPTDVADPAAVEAAAERVEQEFGPIDVWVNNAMCTILAPLHEITVEEFHRVTAVTYLGQVHGTMAALRRMRPRGRGTIVQVGSALAFRGIPLQTAYCGAKHAVQGFTESVRTELMHEGIDVQISEVHLPAMNTPQFSWCRTRLPRHPQPVPPIYQPEVAARAVVHVVDHPRRHLLVGSATVRAVWGNKIAPGLADRYLARSGYDSQQTDTPVAADRPDNLFLPVPGDAGAHGIFGDRAKRRSRQLWASMHRSVTVPVAAVVLLLAILALVAIF
ncbi:MAG: SDR family oxidoreductase [Candidatus Krumholzibacteriia bacterium]